MRAPLLSRPLNADQIRRELAALNQEIEASRSKRDGIVRAIAERQNKKARLESQLALCESAPSLLTAAACG